MSERHIQIGNDEHSHQIILPEHGLAFTMIHGGDASRRRQVLRHLALSIHAAGISVLITDTHGSLSGLASEAPVTFWDLRGVSGLPLRTTVTELGPLLTARLLGLNEEQKDLLLVAFKLADDHGLLLIDAKDLRALLSEMIEHASDYEKEYGPFDRQDALTMIHKIVLLEADGADSYLFEPAIDIHDFLAAEEAKDCRIHLLDARAQEDEKTLYSCYLMFLLGEFYENLPDIPEEEHGRLMIMLDEAQLMLTGLSDSLQRRLRYLLEGLADKGIYVCLSLPEESDLPAYLQSQARTLLQIDRIGQVIWSVSGSDETPPSETGEAGHSILRIDSSDAKDRPAALSSGRRAEIILHDPLHEKYKIPFDRDSAYEFLKRRGLAESGSWDDSGNSSEDNRNSGTHKDQNAKEEQGTDQESLQKMARQAKSSAKSLGNTVAGTVGRQVGKKIGSSFGDFGETLGGNIGASLGRGIINTLFAK